MQTEASDPKCSVGGPFVDRSMVPFDTTQQNIQENSVHLQWVVRFLQFCENGLLTVWGDGRISRFTEREGGAAGPAGLVQTRSRNWLDC